MTTFPPDTRRMFSRIWRGDSMVATWTLYGRPLAVQFHYEPGRDTCTCAIEVHYHCHEDEMANHCEFSPTGFCHCSWLTGSALAGQRLLERFDASGDEATIWRTLIDWYEDRKDERDPMEAADDEQAV